MLATESRMYDKINKCKIKTHLKSQRSHPHSLLPSYFSTNSALCCCCQDHHWPDIRSVDSTGNGAKQPTPRSFLGFSATCSLHGVGHRPRPLASRQQPHSLEECLKTAVPCSNSPLSGIKSELLTWKTGPFIITFQATHSLPNASFHSHPWTFAHAGLCRQRPSFHSTVCPANAHSSSKTSLLHYLLRSSFCILPSLPGEGYHLITLVYECCTVRTPLFQPLCLLAPRAQGWPLFISASLCLAQHEANRRCSTMFMYWRLKARSWAPSLSGRVTDAPQRGLWRENQVKGSCSNSFIRDQVVTYYVLWRVFFKWY